MKKQKFGEILRLTRKKVGISQKQLSEGLCSQPMISSIEKGIYVPNGKLLVALCERLGINSHLLVLHDHYEIGQNKDISKHAEELCSAHDYQGLYNFLQQDDVLEEIDTDEQIQAYYYYLGCSLYHVKNQLDECEDSFKLSVAEINSSKKLSTLSRLCYASLGLVNCKKGRITIMEEYLQKSYTDIATDIYEENGNVIFYLNAFSYFEIKNYQRAYKLVNDGIKYILKNNSHFMLANMYYLLAMISSETEELNIEKSAKEKSETLEEIFGETIYKDNT
ncbi:helix-turn-helix transcriptional regulator [Carnobacterium maltaromaticum]|uniref:helix-turn-helix domain-containing protein n=1 Tax=Carnobacterium maltaromaticum TaxID=2751 RepID=UPI00295F090A|nr:helix-turn-helix transcriptional regulator [Carnobacterium maltaromaticum]